MRNFFITSKCSLKPFFCLYFVLISFAGAFSFLAKTLFVVTKPRALLSHKRGAKNIAQQQVNASLTFVRSGLRHICYLFYTLTFYLSGFISIIVFQCKHANVVYLRNVMCNFCALKKIFFQINISTSKGI